MDNDGDLDAFVGEGDGTLNYFENTGTATSPSFAIAQSNPFGLTDVGNSSNPTFADINGDGRLDAFVGARDGTLIYFENTGTATSPSFAIAQSNPFGFTDIGFASTPTLVDIDGDGDLDALVGESDGTLNYFENTG
ncbi:MAG: VCBS repeat-containing protein, partial [Cyanobacteria bacterium J06639_18]